jgi:hypothetical protein
MPGKKKIKAKKKITPKLPKRLILPDDEPVKLNMTFEEAIKRALNTPIKSSKVKRK